MRPTLRWLLLGPVIALVVLASWSLYPLGRFAALSACPDSLRVTESTTDFSQPDYSVESIVCSTGWFPVAEASLVILAIIVSFLAACVSAYRLSPSHRRLSAALSSLIVVGLVVAAFAYQP